MVPVPPPQLSCRSQRSERSERWSLSLSKRSAVRQGPGRGAVGERMRVLAVRGTWPVKTLSTRTALVHFMQLFVLVGHPGPSRRLVQRALLLQQAALPLSRWRPTAHPCPLNQLPPVRLLRTPNQSPAQRKPLQSNQSHTSALSPWLMDNHAPLRVCPQPQECRQQGMLGQFLLPVQVKLQLLAFTLLPSPLPHPQPSTPQYLQRC